MALTTGQLARQAGVGVETLRFYEREGLLPEPARRASGYRQYPPEAVERVRFIRRAQRLGFPLSDVRELLALRDDPAADRAEVRARAAARLADVERRVRELEALRAELTRLVASCPGPGALADCPILRAIAASSG